MKRSQSAVFRWLLFQQYDHAMNKAENALKMVNQHQDRLLSGMDSDNNESMPPEEVYLMLKADMISIKQQEEALQTEIGEIASKFHQLLETCGTPGTDSDRESGTMAPPSTPSFLKTTQSSLTHVTNLETPTFLKQETGRTVYTTLSSDSDDETRTLFPDNVSYTEPVVNSSDGLPLDISGLSSKTLVIDNNSNYLESPHNESAIRTPIIEAIPSLENTSTSTNSTNSSSSSHRMSSSDGYPKSDESTDNQIVPECYDLDKEFMSRLQYYSDFTVDRQRKINSIVSKLGCSVADNSPCAVTEEILTRHVEGKESSPEKVPFVKPTPVAHSGSGSDYMSTPTSRHMRTRRERTRRHHTKSGRKSSSIPLASSTMLDDSFSSSGSSHRGGSAIPQASSTMICDSESSSSSSRRNRTNGSNPRACSTMLNDSFLSSGSGGSGSSRQKSSSFPKANSTMISEAQIPYYSSEPSISAIHSASRQSLNSDNDCESVYTWSIHDGDSGSDKDISLEESYMKNINHSNKKQCFKPPLPPSKRQRSGSVSSRDSDSEKLCQDHKLHKLLGEPCTKDILESISVIQSNGCHDGGLFIDSLYEDAECAVPKANTIPRSSTRMRLQDKSSGSSSIEARRASLPDLNSVCTSNNNDDQSVPESLSSVSDEDTKALPERLECQGKSSSSTDNPSVSASMLEPSQLSQGSGNIDSILTDSPNSVCSSGINAPYNSPGTNISSSSRVSCSTTSDSKSSDSNANFRAPPVNFLPRNIPISSDSPKVQNIDIQDGAVFKVPKQNLPLRHLFKFGRKGKSPKAKTPTTRESVSPAESQGNSRRQLFPSAGTANLQQETRVMDKKAVIKKFKRFSSSFGKTDRSGKPKIETLANL